MQRFIVASARTSLFRSRPKSMEELHSQPAKEKDLGEVTFCCRELGVHTSRVGRKLNDLMFSKSFVVVVEEQILSAIDISFTNSSQYSRALIMPKTNLFS